LEYLELDPRVRAQTRVPNRSLSPDPSVDEALRLLFHGKCAFCECKVETRPYRFRPTNDADPRYPSETMSHLSYGWLADVWENLYPICLACRPRQRNLFPVWNGIRAVIPTAEEYRLFVEARSASWPNRLMEHPYLLDPCGGSPPWNHLFIDGSFRLQPRSEDGKFTIEHFDLNRPKLVQRRSEALAGYLAGAPPTSDDEFYGLWAVLNSRNTEASGYAGEEQQLSGPVPPAPPRVRSVRLRNFKALEDLEFDVPFDPLSKQAQAVLILGENAAGKSSILEGIALCMLPEAGLNALNEPPDRYRLDPRLMGGASDQEQRTSASVEVTFDDGSVRRLKITTGAMKGGKETPPYPVYAYGAYRHYLEVTREWSPDRPVISLFRSDNLLSNPEKWLLSLGEDDFAEVVQALRFIFGAVETFALIEREPENERCYVVGPRDGNAIRTPISSVSSGFRTVLALACDVMRWTLRERAAPTSDGGGGSLMQSLHNARGLVLIDEVEAHLHPRWKIQIMHGLRTSLPSMTFIVTTHDPLCIRGMQPGEVKVLRRIREKTASELPIHVEALTDLPDPTRLTIEQLLTSDLFGLYSADDPWTEQRLARLADYLTGDAQVRSRREVRDEWRRLREELAKELPMGQTEPARLIQEVVAQYMVKRGTVGETERLRLRAETKKLIRNRLGDLL
jgi:energy-coupling factor transporter ATP-binding protein EcfA2